MRLEHLRERLRSLGAKPCHERLVLRAWTQALPLDSGPRHPGDFLPLAVRKALSALVGEFAAIARIVSQHPGADDSSRLLVALRDGQTIESVLLPGAGLCVSTQVGCAVGCVFCMTGQGGLARQLGSAEIVAQVALARSLRPVKKVVFMGMGEPAHNLDNVLEAIEWLGTEGELGHKNLVFSTVGDPRVFERLPQGRVKPALALSLHSTIAARRAQLLPRAPRIDIAALVEQGERYARATHYPIQYQWTLLAGINDTDAEIDGIVRLLAGKYAVMNLIAYNAVGWLAFRRPPAERAAAMASRLNERGVLTKLRQSAGQDVEGGCGQLRARVIPVVRAGAVAIAAAALTACAMLPGMAAGLAAQGAKGLVAVSLGPLSGAQDDAEKDRCVRYAARGLSVSESLEAAIPMTEGTVREYETVYWRPEFAREGYPQIERARTPVEGTLALTGRAVFFVPPPGATSVRIPFELVQDVEVLENPDSPAPRAMVVKSCSGRYDIFTFGSARPNRADVAATTAAAGELKSRVAALAAADK